MRTQLKHAAGRHLASHLGRCVYNSGAGRGVSGNGKATTKAGRATGKVASPMLAVSVHDSQADLRTPTADPIRARLPRATCPSRRPGRQGRIAPIQRNGSALRKQRGGKGNCLATTAAPTTAELAMFWGDIGPPQAVARAARQNARKGTCKGGRALQLGNHALAAGSTCSAKATEDQYRKRVDILSKCGCTRL